MNGSCCSPTGPITNLPVRQNLSAAIEAAHQQGWSAAVIVMKVGDLTEINHWHGYATGDRVIETVMERIESCLSEGHFVGRLGGGHFLVFLRTQLHRAALAEHVEQLISRVSSAMDFGAGALFINCTAGVSQMPDDALVADQLLRNAELALRSARIGNQAFYSEALQQNLASHAEIRSALVGALERKEFFLAYQPQVCMKTGETFAVEALLRWQSPSLGLVPPDRFIPVAESTGLMPELGDWILESACLQASEWLKEGKPLRVAVNISAAQLEERGFASRVQEILADCHLPASWLEIEVTESMLVGHVEDTQRTLLAIRDAGVKLALDDFGTGYSNLAYLRHFVFDTLKIDRLFTSAVTDARAGDVLVRAIIAMGAELGHEIVAEGVETAEQMQSLQKLGCSRMQGYYFSRPVRPEEILRD
ncbi:bifunctional diguanylate cyclase/phosphodiesterase [Marinobacter sp. NFXS11]|uniref:putative bifunctional diguanylate cyclase/phosphodiesterase n=1 Tax=Marinobacter sp. NFXS11 TaxID=2818432 RepID=UPI0032DE49C8